MKSDYILYTYKYKTQYIGALWVVSQKLIFSDLHQ